MSSALESIFVKRNNLAQNSKSESTFRDSTASMGKKKINRKQSKANHVKQLRNSTIDPNSPNYSSQLLKEQLRKKFNGYDYGLSDW